MNYSLGNYTSDLIEDSNSKENMGTCIYYATKKMTVWFWVVYPTRVTLNMGRIGNKGVGGVKIRIFLTT